MGEVLPKQWGTGPNSASNPPKCTLPSPNRISMGILRPGTCDLFLPRSRASFCWQDAAVCVTELTFVFLCSQFLQPSAVATVTCSAHSNDPCKICQ